MKRKLSTVTICVLSTVLAVLVFTGCPAQLDAGKASAALSVGISQSSEGVTAVSRTAEVYDDCTLTAVMYNEDLVLGNDGYIIQTIYKQCSTASSLVLTFDEVDIGTRISIGVTVKDNTDDRIVAEGRSAAMTIIAGDNPIDLDLVVYPSYKCLVKFDAAGGTVDGAAVKTVYIAYDDDNDLLDEENIPAPTSLVKTKSDGIYTFADKWLTSEGTEFDFKKTQITEEITLYAKWNYRSCIVMYRDDGSAEELKYTESKKLAGASVTGAFSAGAFLTGRSVEIGTFMLGANEVTYDLWYNVKQWAESSERSNVYTFANAGRAGSAGTRGAAPAESDKYMPVTDITWYDAAVWCNALSELTAGNDKTAVYTIDGEVLRSSKNLSSTSKVSANLTLNGFRLPTEAEWEFAARGADPEATAWSYKWSGTDIESSLAAYIVYNSGAVTSTSPAGTDGTNLTRTANTAGFADMGGNVWEWTNDKYNRHLDNGGLTASTDVSGLAEGAYRVLRGGSWKTSGTLFIGVTGRYGSNPSIYGTNIGFRTARTGSVQ